MPYQLLYAQHEIVGGAFNFNVRGTCGGLMREQGRNMGIPAGEETRELHGSGKLVFAFLLPGLSMRPTNPSHPPGFMGSLSSYGLRESQRKDYLCPEPSAPAEFPEGLFIVEAAPL